MNREKKIIIMSILGIIVNVILVIFKSIVGIIVNSIAIILDAVNNLTDALSSVITIIGTKLANKAPDKKHPYGHGRIEYFTSVIIATIILVAGLTAIKESFEKILIPGEPEYSIASLIIIAVAVVVKFAFGKYIKKVGTELKSQSLTASGQDAFMDSILSLTTLVAAILNYIWNLKLEGYLGVIIGLFIIKSAVEMLKESVNTMIGVREDKEFTDSIKRKIASYKDVQGVYDLALHNYGPSKIIGDVHIQVRDDMTAYEIHTLTKQISIDMFNEFGIILTIGIYAANDKKEFIEIKSEISKITKEYPEIEQVHGFYVDEINDNIYFDLIINFEAKNQEKIRNEICKKLSDKFPKYDFIIILDANITD